MGIFNYFNKEKLSDLEPQIPREELIRKGRILVIDDEYPKVIDDLKKEGFSVDFDKKGEDTAKIAKGIYDLIILDFGGVGVNYGKDQGLSLLKHIKRINPAPFVLAYTSKGIKAGQDDFYRLTDGTLKKDAGIEESFSTIESSLRTALSLEHLFQAAVVAGGIPNDSKEELESLVAKAIKNKNKKSIFQGFEKIMGMPLKETITGVILTKLIELGIEKGIEFL